MARVRIDRPVVLTPRPNVSILLDPSPSRVLPDSLIDAVVAAGAGVRLSHRGETGGAVIPGRAYGASPEPMIAEG